MQCHYGELTIINYGINVRLVAQGRLICLAVIRMSIMRRKIMKKNLICLASLTGALLIGCATQSTNTFQAFQPVDLNPQVKSGKLVQKTDSFFIINDSSSSMSNAIQDGSGFNGTKLDKEKDLLNKFNKTIPNIPLSSGLLSFGYGSCVSWGSSMLNQPLQKYSPAGFDGAIGSLHCSSGGTPLADAITATQPDLSSAPGNIALIILSDGKDDSPAGPAAEAMKAKYGDRLCIYTVWVGNHNELYGKTNLDQIADISECGMATDAASISSASGMGDFVTNVFFKPGVPQPPVAPKPPKGKCAEAPKGAIVDKDGCWAFHGVLFDFDSDKINAKFSASLKNVVDVMNQNPGLTVEIEGHTDSYGTDAYNQKLSERRAASVKRELMKHGIDGRRLTTAGFGESQPADTNDTDAGRAYNRRVVFKRTDK